MTQCTSLTRSASNYSPFSPIKGAAVFLNSRRSYAVKSIAVQLGKTATTHGGLIC
nr:MAG TPA: hypothetical protein [Caudoviricetes sp.]